MIASIRNGDKFDLNCGSTATVIDYVNSQNIYIMFESGYKTKVDSGQLIKGQVYDKFLKSIYNIGFIGSGKYNSQYLSYRIWNSMLTRCYSGNDKYYSDCTVCNEWHNFQNFSEWYYKNYKFNYQLDKDLLKYGNRIYSPDNCLLVPVEINMFANKNKLHNKQSKADIKYYWNIKSKRLKFLSNEYPEYSDILRIYFEMFFNENYDISS